MSFIYIVGDNTGRVKIGVTNNVRKRVSSLNTGRSTPLSVLGVMAGTIEQEKALHAKFNALHVRGEWFRRSPEIDEFVAQCEVFDPVRHVVQPDARGRVHNEEAKVLLRELATPIKGGEQVRAQITRVTEMLPTWTRDKVRAAWYGDNRASVSSDEILELRAAVEGRRQESPDCLYKRIADVEAALTHALKRIGDIEKAAMKIRGDA